MGSVMASDPLVSCLMVTLASPARMPLIQRSIADYAAQTWPRRELVVVCDPTAGEARELNAYVAGLGRDDIRLFPTKGPLALGALRNLSRANAQGDIHCQWDDDDRFHPTRIERQLAALGDADALLLEQVMMLTPALGALHCLSWRGVDLGAMPATLMCRRDAPARYKEEADAPGHPVEDTDFLRQLLAAGRVTMLPDAPHLYVYVAHGANSWHEGHIAMLRERLALSRGLLQRREPVMRESLAAFDFGGPVRVMGANGEAFALAPQDRGSTATRSA
ncbi:MAG TPA: glycosyltransferase family A protein [Caulobacteraceae bacterium]|jgi:glycosyltransferase involved in cell wall biosynthesis